MHVTIDIPEDLHRAITSLATRMKTSFSKAALELMQRGLEQSKATNPHRSAIHEDAETGLLVAKATRVITSVDVKTLEDDS